MPKAPTWKWLTGQEPRLRTLERDIRAVRDEGGSYFCANQHWYGRADSGFKGRLYYLVGFMSRNPALRTMGAYDVATEHLYAQLPDCRNCGCM